jgi:hypothetical protein
LVTYVEKFSAASTRVRIGDVLLAVDGHRVSETGEVLFRAHEWLSYDYIITTKMFGECARLRLLRCGESETDADRMVVVDVVRLLFFVCLQFGHAESIFTDLGSTVSSFNPCLP